MSYSKSVMLNLVQHPSVRMGAVGSINPE